MCLRILSVRYARASDLRGNSERCQAFHESARVKFVFSVKIFSRKLCVRRAHAPQVNHFFSSNECRHVRQVADEAPAGDHRMHMPYAETSVIGRRGPDDFHFVVLPLRHITAGTQFIKSRINQPLFQRLREMRQDLEAQRLLSPTGQNNCYQNIKRCHREAPLYCPVRQSAARHITQKQ